MKTKLFLCAALALLVCAGCTEDWLNIKPDKKLVVPSTIAEVQAMLDDSGMLNTNAMSNVSEVSTDNVYLTWEQWNSKTNIEERNAYVWASDIYEGAPVFSWITHFGQVYYANNALEALTKLSAENQADALAINNIRGSALFLRSWAFFHLAQLFAKHYDKATAATDPGIPLRLESNILLPTKRATVAQVYDQVIADVVDAAALLPELPAISTRPSRVAAYGLLAKVHLQMGLYEPARNYADSVLSIQSELLDYREIDGALRYPFELFNKEVVFYQTMAPTTFYINPAFYDEYTADDLRKTVFFHQEGNYQIFKGSYSNSRTYFAGIAVDELFLIRAECNARLQNYGAATSDLYHLMDHRYVSDHEGAEVDVSELLDVILSERRKQLLYRGLRWQDLRRLNLEEGRQTTITRDLGDVRYTLPPNDSRYMFALPDDVIRNNPGIVQNER